MSDERCPDCNGWAEAPNLVPTYSAATGERDGSDICEHPIHDHKPAWPF